MMPNPLDDATRALDDAIAASQRTHRGRLLRAARNQRIRTGVVFGLATCMAFITLAAFVAGDREASMIIALMTCWAFAFALLTAKIGRKRTLESLREMDHST
jgi:hypothetical protein